jgi:hypothetical protein
VRNRWVSRWGPSLSSAYLSSHCVQRADQLSITVTGVTLGADLYPIACMSSNNESVQILPNSVQPGTEGKRKKKN